MRCRFAIGYPDSGVYAALNRNERSAMVPEAKLKETESGLVPEGEGWFVVNTREARWFEHAAFGRYSRFEGDARFPEFGINISVLEPGNASCMYHGENNQEDFLVLTGECLLLVEGEERPLKAWDFVHCPAWTEHVFVGAGSGPCLLLSVGTRNEPDEVIYPVAEVAQRHGGSVEEETRSAEEAYARFPKAVERRFQQGDLPDW
jgi:uncharacterized cupin superfamily protein